MREIETKVAPEVSVIIPVYNGEKFVGQAIESVLHQTYTDWELIIVDDGSEDNTKGIMRCYSDPKIQYFYQENQGLSGARNTGIDYASGKYIALLDADDEWEPTFLEVSAGYLNQNPETAAVYSGFQYIDSEGNPIGTPVCKVVTSDHFHDEIIASGNWLSACSVVVRRSIYREIGGFDGNLKALEDTDMWLQISKDYCIDGIPQVLTRYRRLASNMSDDTERMIDAYYMLIEKHYGTLSDPFSEWSEDKKAFGHYYHMMGILGFTARQEYPRSARSVEWLAQYFLRDAVSLHLWYTIACSHQIVGTRGSPANWVEDRAAKDVRGIIQNINLTHTTTKQILTISQLALGILCYNQGNIPKVRHYIVQSLVSSPKLCLLNKRWYSLALRALPGVHPMIRLIKQRYKQHPEQVAV